MPKYYRFRALTPTRKPKRNRDQKNDKELEKLESQRNWLDLLALGGSPAASWYLRRTSWRQSTGPMGLPSRQLASNRPTIFGLKILPSGAAQIVRL